MGNPCCFFFSFVGSPNFSFFFFLRFLCTRVRIFIFSSFVFSNQRIHFFIPVYDFFCLWEKKDYHLAAEIGVSRRKRRPDWTLVGSRRCHVPAPSDAGEVSFFFFLNQKPSFVPSFFFFFNRNFKNKKKKRWNEKAVMVQADATEHAPISEKEFSTLNVTPSLNTTTVWHQINLRICPLEIASTYVKKKKSFCCVCVCA